MVVASGVRDTGTKSPIPVRHVGGLTQCAFCPTSFDRPQKAGKLQRQNAADLHFHYFVSWDYDPSPVDYDDALTDNQVFTDRQPVISGMTDVQIGGLHVIASELADADSDRD